MAVTTYLSVRQAAETLRSARIEARDPMLQRAFDIQLARVALEMARRLGERFPLEEFVLHLGVRVDELS